MKSSARKQEGFSLIELSTVLVVIGLLVGGVLVASGMSRSAELKAVAAEQSRLIAAVTNFRNQYGALPGDLTNATSFWGADAGCTATASNTVRKAATCNGNGDGYINVYGNAATYYERYRASQQLANAGMIEGTYTGVSGSGGGLESSPGVNIPASKVAGAGYTIANRGTVSGDADAYDGQYGHQLYFGGFSAAGPSYGAVLTPQEAWSIDKKLDDGLPAYGRIMAWKSTGTIAPNCATTGVSSTAAYNLTNSSVVCSLNILMNIGN